MEFLVEVHEATGARRVSMIPGEPGGVFVLDGDGWNNGLYVNRAVGKIGIAGMKEPLIDELCASEPEFQGVLTKDEETGSYRLAPEYDFLALIGEIDPPTPYARARGRSIQSFREFSLL